MAANPQRDDAIARLHQSRREIHALREELHGRRAPGSPDRFPRSWIMRTLLSSERRTLLGAGALALGVVRPRWLWTAARALALPLARRYLLPLLFR